MLGDVLRCEARVEVRSVSLARLVQSETAIAGREGPESRQAVQNVNSSETSRAPFPDPSGARSGAVGLQR